MTEAIEQLLRDLGWREEAGAWRRGEWRCTVGHKATQVRRRYSSNVAAAWPNIELAAIEAGLRGFT